MPVKKTIKLDDGGRKLTFRVRQMFAHELETWLLRVAETLPPEKAGPLLENPIALSAYILKRGLLALACANDGKAQPLLEDLLQCCSVVDEDSGAETTCTSQNIQEHITEARTLFLLRKAALRTNLDFALEGTRKSLLLPRYTAYRRAKAEETQVRTANVPPVSACLISHGMVSLNELRTTYNYNDALDLLEVVSVRNYNQWAGHEAASRKRR